MKKNSNKREPSRKKQVGGTIQKSIGEHYAKYIEDLIATGRYMSVAEVLREALRLHEREFDNEKN